ncbi:MAG TPA: M50 family metallopeptidase [Candidatus Saccharimonadales bacterium]|jgi:regulator of sigma E protease|nr:M50 family metallopeptidase [Candidatus Saccharimonadales bacterium]
MAILLFIVGIILFIGLVVVHEFGHFIVARRNGVEVEEFGIFFPPRLYKKKTKGGWLFSLNLIPLGGFVKLKGEHDSDTELGSFGAASLWVKSKIMAAGVVMNLATALVLLTLLALIGMPKLIPNQYTVKSDTQLVSQQVLIGEVESGSPAAKAGLKAEDVLTNIAIAGHSPVAVNDYSKLPDVTKRFAGQTVEIFYLRGGQHHETKASLLTVSVVEASQKTNNPKGYLGIVPTQFTVQRSTWSAPIVAVGLTAQVTALTFQGLGHALGGLGSLIAGALTGNHVARENGQTSASAQVAGPVGIFVILKDGSLLGYQFMLFIIAIISLTLAIMNILPVPALDGGRLWITLAARGIKRPLSPQAEEAVNFAGFIVLISLIILVTFVDVKRFL